MLSLLFFTLLVLNLHAFELRDLYVPSQTLDGTKVQYISQNKNELELSRQSVAYALYTSAGAYVYYDKELFFKLGSLAKFLILEHERAHHYLGHSAINKHFRKLGTFPPSHLGYKKEKDADCAAGYALARLKSKIQKQDILNALDQVFFEISAESKRPQWVLNRLDVIWNCYKGELLPEPQPLLLKDF